MWLVDVSTVSPCRCGGPIAEAVVGRAEVRSPLDHTAREVLPAMRGGAQHAGVSPFSPGVKKSVVHSQTFPAMSKRP